MKKFDLRKIIGQKNEKIWPKKIYGSKKWKNLT